MIRTAPKSATDSDFGSDRIPRVIDDVAEGSRATIKRARRADPLDRIDLPPEHRQAARIYRQAAAHVAAGRGMGPLPYGRDVAPTGGPGAQLCAQERALSAAEWHRRGVQAMGLAAAEGVVHWVVIVELPLSAYDATRKWREGRGATELRAALERLAVAYGA